MAYQIIDPLRISLKPRAKDVFKLFLSHRVLSRKKIEKLLGIRKSWAHRLIQILERYGFIKAAYESRRAPYQHYILRLCFWPLETGGDGQDQNNAESGDQPP